MDDFEAPSFSLGLDEEIHESPASHAVLPTSNPFRVRAPERNGTVAKAVDTAPFNGTGNTVYDSDFELSPPSNTERIMKRLKRKSGQPTSAPSNPQQHVHHDNSISKAKGMGSQNICKGSNEKKTSLPGKTPTRRAAESNVQTLQNFWKGLNDKTALNFPADSGCKDYTESKVECTGQGFGQATLSKPMEPSARMSRSQTGASQVCDGTISDSMANCSDQHRPASKAGVYQRYAKTPCGEKEGLLSQRPYGEKEGLLSQRPYGEKEEEWGTCRANTIQSFETCIDVEMHEELATRNSEQSTFKTLERSGNSLHYQRVGFHQRVATNSKGNAAQTSQKNLDENCNFLDDFSFASSCETEFPMQSSWRSIDAKTKNSARCERQSLGKSAEGPQMAPKDKLIDSHLECPANVSQSKTSISSSQNKTNALHRFWRSLNEKKSSPCETDIGAEDDDIENCSDDDFEIGTQSARKLSLCGNATTRKSFAIGNAAADNIFGPSSDLIETSANARANNSSASQYPPNAWASPRLTVRSAANTFSASPRTYQSFVVGDALRVSPVHNLDKFQTNPSSFLEKLSEATPKNIPWPSIDDGNADAFFLPHEDRALDDCAMPTNASEANSNPFGGNSSLSVDPILSNDSKIANLLRIRFPHFTSISSLRQGYFIGPEQVYIDYGNQFSGGKTTSCQSGPRVFKQHARQAAPRSSTKCRQAALKKQKIAMADNDGWIQTGNRNPSRNCAPKKQKIAMADNDGWIQTGNRNLSRNCAMKSKKGHKGSQVCNQNPVNTDVDSSVGAGHWVTERTGKRIYITKDGRKLSGSSAYNQHIKDSGKRSKKTKRRRPRNKK